MLKWAKLAKQAKPSHYQFQKLLADSLWANGDFAGYREASQNSIFGMRRGSSLDEFRAAVAANDNDLQKTIRDHSAQLGNGTDGFNISANMFETAAAIVRGDAKAYLASTSKIGEEIQMQGVTIDHSFHRAILERKLDEAEKFLTKSEGTPDGGDELIRHGLLALAAYKAGRIPLAEKHAHLFADQLITI